MAGLGVISQLVGFVAQKFLPQPSVDNPSANANVRLGTYGEIAVNNYLQKKTALAAEGSYYVATGTPGTAAVAAGPYPTTYASTAGWFFFQNFNATGGPSAYLDYLKLIVTAAVGATPTAWNFAVIRDVATPLSLQVPAAAAHITGVVPVNTNGGSPNKSNCVFGYQNSATASVNVAPSSASAVIGRTCIGSGLGVIGDEYVLDFGATDPAPVQGLTAAEAATAGRKVGVLPPIVVAPGQQIMIVPWWPGATTSGLGYEFEMTHFER
jgi:hypothetical protein